MRTKQQILDERSWLVTKAGLLRNRLAVVEQELAECLAKFKNGQRVIHTYGSSSEEFEITGVFLWTSAQVRYVGRKVIKSGELHKTPQELYGHIVAKPDAIES